jgi:hypothetical protein
MVHNNKVCGQWPGREALLFSNGPTDTFEQPGPVLETTARHDQRIQ